MEKNAKKELAAAYKSRKQAGGVYAIKNAVNHKLLLLAAADLAGARNRFTFARETGSCVHIKLQKDWENLGAAVFEFEVLDELEKGENQTPRQFKDDLDALLKLWLEKLAAEEMY